MFPTFLDLLSPPVLCCFPSLRLFSSESSLFDTETLKPTCTALLVVHNRGQVHNDMPPPRASMTNKQSGRKRKRGKFDFNRVLSSSSEPESTSKTPTTDNLNICPTSQYFPLAWTILIECTHDHLPNISKKLINKS